ncbi:MAG: radical SAM protein [Planctomycetia bacterium]|nr:radical SAM protein [Planctomycetia bacterium]
MDAPESSGWPELIPPEWIDRIRRCGERGIDPTPLTRQCVLSPEELRPQPPAFTENPLEEQTGTLLLKKYAGRALILTEAGCAMRCRFCFRRHTQTASPPSDNRSSSLYVTSHTSSLSGTLPSDPPAPSGPLGNTPRKHPGKPLSFVDRFHDAIRQIAADPGCHEVILSGGDPMTQPESLLAMEYRQLAGIPHVRRVRIHTRIPVIAPLHTPDPTLFRQMMPRLTTIVVLHVNHPLETDRRLGERPMRTIAALVDAGLPVLCQTTLLRGVNDSADTLTELFERLVDMRVIPYYLHQLDRVAGAAHFEVPVDQGRLIMEQLRNRLPGYAVPRYVREIPGEMYKKPL